MARVGYIRVSTIDQNEDRQLQGIELDKKFIDKATGKNMGRPQLEEMKRYVREGDEIFIHSMDRLARNLLDLRSMVDLWNGKGIKVTFIKEALTFDGNNSPMSMLLLSLMGAVAEFELSLIKERQAEGIALAKKRGVYPKSKKRKLSDVQIAELKQMVEARYRKTDIMRKYGISRQSVYVYLKK
jgi:DNA invertase Pin-like site-specific DNA recombinase